MSTCLLDVNILIAMHTPSHQDHPHATRWFQTQKHNAFATCALTETGFLRVSANISAVRDVGYEEAKIAVASLRQHPRHQFWASEIGYLDATSGFNRRIHGPGQITDAYLLGLAIHYKGKLATLDRGILHLSGTEFRHAVELIS